PAPHSRFARPIQRIVFNRSMTQTPPVDPGGEPAAASRPARERRRGPREEDPVARYTIEEYVRWEDIDAAGIINYQAYLRFFGLAEAELYRSCGLSYREMFDEVGVWLPRVHVECDFRVPVTLDELLVVEAWFGKIGTTS